MYLVDGTREINSDGMMHDILEYVQGCKGVTQPPSLGRNHSRKQSERGLVVTRYHLQNTRLQMYS